MGNIPKDAVRFEFGFVKYGFAWAFPLKESVNIGLGTFINNSLLEDEEENKDQDSEACGGCSSHPSPGKGVLRGKVGRGSGASHHCMYVLINQTVNKDI